jgi:hypothetical protein
VLTSGYGVYDRFGSVANNEYVTAAMASDATLMVAYLPTARTVTVSMSKFAGKVTAKWFDPSNGTYTTISGSPFDNAGNKHFAPPGNNSDNSGDWVLVIETSGGGDTTPPSITGVTASNVTTSSAVVNWATNEPADTQVEYGLTPSYGQATQLDSSLVTTHFASLAGLTASTTYHYRVRSRDGSGNLATSGDGVIVTSAAPDTTAPSISSVAVSNVTATTAVASWSTNEPADSQVEYGLTTSYGSTTTLNTSLVTAHAASLAGLTANTTYHYRVRSKDAAGNLAVSSDGTFATTSISSLTAQLLGESAEDRVGANVTPNGIRDLLIRLQGLTGVPAKVRITGNPVGVWETPYNGLNWPIATQYAGNGTGDLWFDPLPGTNAFHVQVWYSNGTTAEVDATAGSPPSPPGSLVAQFLGASADDHVGMSVTPNGIHDLLIRLQRLTGVPTKVRITGILSVYGSALQRAELVHSHTVSRRWNGILWFDPLPGTSQFQVQVWYADGSTAQAVVN